MSIEKKPGRGNEEEPSEKWFKARKELSDCLDALRLEHDKVKDLNPPIIVPETQQQIDAVFVGTMATIELMNRDSNFIPTELFVSDTKRNVEKLIHGLKFLNDNKGLESADKDNIVQ